MECLVGSHLGLSTQCPLFNILTLSHLMYNPIYLNVILCVFIIIHDFFFLNTKWFMNECGPYYLVTMCYVSVCIMYSLYIYTCIEFRMIDLHASILTLYKKIMPFLVICSHLGIEWVGKMKTPNQQKVYGFKTR